MEVEGPFPRPNVLFSFLLNFQGVHPRCNTQEFPKMDTQNDGPWKR